VTSKAGAIDADEVPGGREAERPRVRLSSRSKLLATARGRR
jgi:hypothetical protein